MPELMAPERRCFPEECSAMQARTENLSQSDAQFPAEWIAAHYSAEMAQREKSRAIFLHAKRRGVRSEESDG
jgi:hypothetical protein